MPVQSLLSMVSIIMVQNIAMQLGLSIIMVIMLSIWYRTLPAWIEYNYGTEHCQLALD